LIIATQNLFLAGLAGDPSILSAELRSRYERETNVSSSDELNLTRRVEVEIEEIYAKFTTIFRDVFDDDTLVVDPALTAKDVPAWDSLTNIRLMLTVEKAYGIRLTAPEVGKLQNVGELARLVQSKLSS
jgi:acyl carrier protein